MNIEISSIWIALIFLPGFLIVAFLTIWGALDVYAMMRFRNKAKVDQTAIMGNWINLKWMFASRHKEMVAKHPWLTQDLSEVLGEKPDDGQVS